MKSILTKSPRSVPMFLSSPLKIVFPVLSLDSLMSPKIIIEAEDCDLRCLIKSASFRMDSSSSVEISIIC